MKISYSIAIILSCTLAQLTSATTADQNGVDTFGQQFSAAKRGDLFSHDETKNFKGVRRSGGHLVNNDNANNRYIATALRRRQVNSPPPQVTAPAVATPSPAAQIQPILKGISDSIRQILASSSDDSSNEQGEEETHDEGDRLEAKQRKDLIKLVKELVKAINDLLKEAGHEDEILDMDGVLKSAEKGTLAAPPSINNELEARGLGALLKSPTSLNRDLTAAAPAAAPEALTDPEHDGGDDGSTEGDSQHKHSTAKVKPAPPAVPAAPAAPAPPTARVSDSDGGTEGDDEHHQNHPNHAKKRSSDPDPKKIKSAGNKVDNALEELNNAAQTLEDGNAPALAQLAAQVEQLRATLSNTQA